MVWRRPASSLSRPPHLAAGQVLLRDAQRHGRPAQQVKALVVAAVLLLLLLRFVRAAGVWPHRLVQQQQRVRRLLLQRRLHALLPHALQSAIREGLFAAQGIAGRRTRQHP